jgi:nucleoside-diphosphate-sugar epimerase
MSRADPSDGPVAVTGASGYIGSQVVAALLRRGYTVRACVTDPANSNKTLHLRQMGRIGLPGKIELHGGNVLANGSYDAIFAGCSAVVHVATPMGAANNTARQIYDGAIDGTTNVLNSVRKARTVRRFVYTSSFAAIVHPAPRAYTFTEADWASDRATVPPETMELLHDILPIPNWVDDDIDTAPLGVAYTIAKVTAEKLCFATAAEDGGFEAMTVCPDIVLGPLLSPLHGRGGWLRQFARLLAGETLTSGWRHLWHIIDVRDVGDAHARIVASPVSTSGDRYQLTSTNPSGELSARDLHGQLQTLFPQYEIGGPPAEFQDYVARHGGPFVTHAYCDKARNDLGLETHTVENTLFDTAKALIDFGLVEPRLKQI